MRAHALRLVTIGLAWLLMAACDDATEQQRRGRALLAAYGCGACHEVPGVRQATGRTGPPLHAFGRRVLVAGTLPNSPANLQQWIMRPQEMAPGTAMPDLGVKAEEAAAMTAYLLSLR